MYIYIYTYSLLKSITSHRIDCVSVDERNNDWMFNQLYLHIYIRIYICIYIYICTHMYMYIYIYISTTI